MWRPLSIGLSVVALVLGSVVSAQDALPPRPHEQLKFPPLRPYTPPTPLRVELPGGLLYLLEDAELPVVDVVVMIRGGQLYETHDKAGLAAMWGEVMRSGGSTTLSGDDLDELLESHGASIEVSAGEDKVAFNLSCLSDDFDQMVGVLKDLLASPSFPADKLALAQKQHLSALARRNDDPAGIARREFARAVYGDDSPYGWSEETATIGSITTSDLRAFHKQVTAGRMFIGVVGAFNSGAARRQLSEAFAGYGKADARAKRPTLTEPKPVVALVRKTDINQSTVVVGHLGIQRRADDHDYFAVVIMNSILGGGGFSSRLLQNVRTDMGLAYSVYSSVSAPYGRRGTFSMVCQTKSESTLKASQAMVAEMRRIRSEDVSAEELAVAKESILNQLVFASESRADVIERALRYAFNDFPADYLQRFQAGIAKVSVEDVRRVANKVLDPEKLLYLIVGNDAKFDAPLSGLGPVVEIPLERAAPAPPAAPVSEDVKESAMELAMRAVAARGGPEALAALKGLRYGGSGVLYTPQGEVPVEAKVTLVFPDKIRIDLASPMFGQLIQCFDGDIGWMGGPTGVMDLPSSQAQDLRRQVSNHELLLLARASSGKAAETYLVAGDQGGALVVDGVELGLAGESLDVVRRMEQRPEGKVEIAYSDHRATASGLRVAYAYTTTVAGERRFSISITSVELNPEVTDDLFVKPSPPAEQPAPQPGSK